METDGVRVFVLRLPVGMSALPCGCADFYNILVNLRYRMFLFHTFLCFFALPDRFFFMYLSGFFFTGNKISQNPRHIVPMFHITVEKPPVMTRISVLSRFYILYDNS